MIEYIKISNGNGKMQDIKSINTNTITNDYCMTKCTFKGQCYSKKHIARFSFYDSKRIRARGKANKTRSKKSPHRMGKK